MRAADPDPQLTALGSEVERHTRELHEVKTYLRQLATRLVDRAAAPEADAPPDAAGAGCWLLAEDPEQARADLEDLTGWLGRVYLQYRGAALPSCWVWHPAVVEELNWLRQSHRDAYHPRTGSAVKVADWHERQRPGVVRRIRAAIGDCELGLHTGPRRCPPCRCSAPPTASRRPGPPTRPHHSRLRTNSPTPSSTTEPSTRTRTATNKPPPRSSTSYHKQDHQPLHTEASWSVSDFIDTG